MKDRMTTPCSARSMNRLLALAALALAAAAASAQTPPEAAASAAAPAPVPAERFFQHPTTLGAKLSPSGQRVALMTSGGNGRVALFVLDLGPTPAGRRVAAFSSADVVRFDWVGDDRLVYGLADLQAGSREDYERGSGLFGVDADGNHAVSLIRRMHAAFVGNGEQRSEALDVSHALLHVPQPQPGVEAGWVVVGGHEFRGRDLAGIHPMWLNTRNGATRPMLLPGAPRSVVRWMFDSKGEARLAVAVADGHHEVHWRPPGEKAWKKLADLDALQPAWWPHSVTDDGALYVVRAEGAAGENVLTRFDFQAMAPGEPVVKTPGFDFDGWLLGGEPGKQARGVHVKADAEADVWFDAAMKQVQEAVDKRLPGRTNGIDCRRCGQPDMVALVHSRSDHDPGRWLLYDAARGSFQPLATAMEGIEPRRMAAVDFQRIQARDGRELPVWLTLPPGLPQGQAAPAVVLVHGGPWVRGGRWAWEPMSQFLASRGYLVIAPDFRGSMGYGQAHFKAGWKQWGLAMQDDVADALLWARQQGLADGRACIAGASYGGYATLMGLARHGELYKCGIAWVGVTDLMLFAKGEFFVTDDISNWGRKYLLPQMVGDAAQDAELLTINSPLAQAGRIKAPVLLAYGAKDRRVPVEHGERLRDALKAAGNPPEWVVYPNEAHGWREPATNADFARRVEAFLRRHLAP